jgi:hypothetical protein
MAHNTLTGSIIAPAYFGPSVGLDASQLNILSGNLSTSDGASILNIPRVENAVDNRLITNLDGDANKLNCEANLTFDGTTLNITGELTASTGISASFLMGDGSRLTGISAGHHGGGGGIFTQVNGSQAYTTSSIQVGSSGTPAHPLSIAGDSFLSGAVIHKRLNVGADYSVTTSDYYVGVDTTSIAVKLTLPLASTTTSGQTFIVKDEGGSGNTNNITISGSGVDTIDGLNQVVLASPHASIQLYCNGVSKYFIC